MRILLSLCVLVVTMAVVTGQNRDGRGPQRGASSGRGPQRGESSDGGPQRGGSSGRGPQRGESSDGGPQRGGSSDGGPQRGGPSGRGPQRGGPSDGGPQRGESSDGGPQREGQSRGGSSGRGSSDRNRSPPNGANQDPLIAATMDSVKRAFAIDQLRHAPTCDDGTTMTVCPDGMGCFLEWTEDGSKVLKCGKISPRDICEVLDTLNSSDPVKNETKCPGLCSYLVQFPTNDGSTIEWTFCIPEAPTTTPTACTTDDDCESGPNCDDDRCACNVDFMGQRTCGRQLPFRPPGGPTGRPRGGPDSASTDL